MTTTKATEGRLSAERLTELRGYAWKGCAQVDELFDHIAAIEAENARLRNAIEWAVAYFHRDGKTFAADHMRDALKRTP